MTYAGGMADGVHAGRPFGHGRPWRKKMRGLRGQRGQQGSMVLETALVLPIFFVLVIGFCEYSFALASYMSATYAVRVGARYASLHSLSSGSPAATSDVKAVVQSNLFLPSGSYDLNSIIVEYGNRSGATPGVGNYQGDLVGVGFQWTQTVNIPFLPTKTYTIAAESYRVIQR